MVDLQPVAVEALHLLLAASRHADKALICVGLSGQEWAKRPLAASGAR